VQLKRKKNTLCKLTKTKAQLYVAITIASLNQGQSILRKPKATQQVIESIGLNDYEYDIIYEFAQSETSKIAQLIN